MRIVAGRWRGRPLVAPEGPGTRPTSDRVREALFSMLLSRIGSFEGLRVADLFAGTGALGLEALSRGAAHCAFVERDRTALDALRTNIARLGAGSVTDIRAQSAETFAGGPFDLVFLDPPYRSGLWAPALARLSLPPGAWVSIETASNEPVAAEGFETAVERSFGKARLTLLRRV